MLVIFGCALFVTVWAVVAVPVGTQLRLPAPSVVNTCPDEPPVIRTFALEPNDTLAPVKLALPDTDSPASVPVLVIFGCALPVTVTAVVAAPDDPQLSPPDPSVVSTKPAEPPVILMLLTGPRLTNGLLNATLPETFKLDNVPIVVMFG